MKKIIALLLTIVLTVSLVSSCNSPTATETKTPVTEPASTKSSVTEANTPESSGTSSAERDMSEIPSESYTIAWGLHSADEATEKQKKYLTEEIGPALNVKFIFSEVLEDAEDLLTFMENAYSSGADAVINSLPNAIETGATKAEELGLYFVSIASTYYPSVENLKHNLGNVGISAQKQAEIFGDVASSVMDDGKSHNVILVSGGASMGVRSHNESTQALLSMMKSKYGLTYDKDIADLAKLSAVTEISTGTDMKITIFPGFGGPTYVSDFSSLLQTGDYDVVLTTYAAFQTFNVAIDEVEKALDIDVKVISVTSINDASLAAFTTKDSHGSTILDAAVINPVNVSIGAAFVTLYNALSNHKDAISPDGKSIMLSGVPWAVYGPEDYLKLAQLDTSHETYTLNSDDVKKMLYVYNPQVNFDYLVQTLNSLTAENLIERKIK